MQLEDLTNRWQQSPGLCAAVGRLSGEVVKHKLQITSYYHIPHVLQSYFDIILQYTHMTAFH